MPLRDNIPPSYSKEADFARDLRTDFCGVIVSVGKSTTPIIRYGQLAADIELMVMTYWKNLPSKVSTVVGSMFPALARVPRLSILRKIFLFFVKK
jgi:hypothetical protein